MNFFLFVVVLTISFIIVRIGAIAFQLTGLSWPLAKFQALSCFTGTGFTTKEAELITGNAQRRRIASVLMVLGNAGLVIMIATFANSLYLRDVIMQRLFEPILPFPVAAPLAAFINIMLLVAAIYGIYKLFSNENVSRKLTRFLRKKLIKKEVFRRVSFEEFLLGAGGYGVIKVDVQPGVEFLNKTLAESGLRKEDILVLAIERGERTIATPPPGAQILAGDSLICFGKLENIRRNFDVNSL
jgi:hypothetical protein